MDFLILLFLSYVLILQFCSKCKNCKNKLHAKKNPIYSIIACKKKPLFTVCVCVCVYTLSEIYWYSMFYIICKQACTKVHAIHKRENNIYQVWSLLSSITLIDILVGTLIRLLMLHRDFTLSYGNNHCCSWYLIGDFSRPCVFTCLCSVKSRCTLLHLPHFCVYNCIINCWFIHNYKGQARDLCLWYY